MATENQIHALEKWLQIPLKDMDFKVASGYLDQLHQASEEFNADKKANNGVVKRAKEAIAAELQKRGLVVGAEAVANEHKPGEKGAYNTLAGEEVQLEADDTTNIELEIHKIAVVMRYAVREATAIVEQEISNSGIGEAAKAGILQRIATTIFIECMRRGL